MKRLIKFYYCDEHTEDFGMLDEKDIKLLTIGFKYDAEKGLYTRKHCKYGYYELDF